MKVQFKGLNGVSMRSGGIHFQIGTEYNVTEQVGKYLMSTFGDAFEVAAIEAEIVKKPATPKPKAAPKPKKATEEE